MRLFVAFLALASAALIVWCGYLAATYITKGDWGWVALEAACVVVNMFNLRGSLSLLGRLPS